MTEATTAVRHRSTVPRIAEERNRTSNHRRAAVRGFRSRIALGWVKSHGAIETAADAIDRMGRALAAVTERTERGEPSIPGEVDAALAIGAGIDPSIMFRALTFATERHYQARYAARVPMPRINPPCRMRRSRSRARRSHRSNAASIGKLAAGDPEPEPPTTQHTATIGGLL